MVSPDREEEEQRKREMYVKGWGVGGSISERADKKESEISTTVAHILP